MFEKFANIFRVPDLRKRVLFTLAMLAVYRLGSHIPTPGINTSKLQQAFESQSGGLLGFYDLFSGGNLRRLTIFALGIMPYITASIILQLLTVVWEPLARLQKEGELGRRKITQWTRYLTLILSFLQSLGIAFTLQSQDFVLTPGYSFIFMTIVTLTTGSMFIMWLGEQITERGVGNGMSLLIFAGIVVGLPRAVQDLLVKARQQAWGSFTIPAMVLLVAIMIAVVAFIVFMERAERRIPVQYAKRVVGRRIMGGQATHLPLRVNSGGVMPVIFASSLLSIPQMMTYSAAFKTGGTLNRYFGGLMEQLRWGEPLYTLLYAVGIVFFAYFYVSIVFNPADVADNMRKHGGFIPGIRPGHRTRDYINDVLTRVTLVGGLYLILISFIPEWMIAGIHLNHMPTWLGQRLFEGLPNWVLNGLGVTFYFGGTSLLIVVGVAMDTVNQIESQLVMRHYEGFTSRSSKVKGRRLWN
ncbi:MAG TPA: preprotein translocase subunit SecY [Terriglobales bacterium]|jgi:preprotein translocase subunit SecY|nr:preprotein translocase subunit SecY [Terriglobales bacterium]